MTEPTKARRARMINAPQAQAALGRYATFLMEAASEEARDWLESELRQIETWIDALRGDDPEADPFDAVPNLADSVLIREVFRELLGKEATA